MVFKYEDLKNIGIDHPDTPSAYGYCTKDSLSNVTATGYFSDPRLRIRAGDSILVQAGDGSDSLIVEDETTAGRPARGPYMVESYTVLRATDFTNQTPGVDVDTTVKFGSAPVNTSLDEVQMGADNVFTCNVAGEYAIRPTALYGRSGSGGTGLVFLRVVVDPATGTFSQIGTTFDVTIPDSASRQIIQGSFFANLQVGWRFKLEIHITDRPDAGLFANTSPPAGWFDAPSADMVITRLETVS